MQNQKKEGDSMPLEIIKPPEYNVYITQKHSYYYRSDECQDPEQVLPIGKCRNVHRTLLQFRLPCPHSCSIISQGLLGLYVSRNENHFTNSLLEIHQILSPWNPEKIDWNNQPLITNTPIATISISSNFLGLISADITSLVQDWLSGAAANFGILLKMQNEAQPNFILIRSKKYPNSSKWPYLQIDHPDCGFNTVTTLPSTINKSYPVTANNSIQHTAGQDILIYNYSYLVVNVGSTTPAEAYLEVSADNTHWEIQSATHIINPGEQVTFVPDVIAQYARLSYQTPSFGQETQLIIYIQGIT
ncbi:hypothetical protein Ga0466249_001242 [Sporomusaceae bacterium BoRhaA]|nr:hypothetical protein [Pelorhabdus rhamnosifermentans]